jgi:hypothetical protein
VPFVVYGVILHVPLPSKLLFAAYYSLTAIAIPTFLLLYWVYRRPGWLGTIASLTLTLSLFSLPLLALWSHIGIQSSAVGELLPFSDASGYYYDARRLLDGHLLGWSARRPLFVGILATLLGLTGQNLQVTLAIFVAVNAVACFLLVREIQVSHGTTAAVMALMLLFFFYRSEGGLGSTLTENLGLPLGITSFAVLWRGAREWRTGSVCLGLGLLTLALAARAGAFFVLPALMFGGAWICRGQNRYSLRFLTQAFITIALSFGLNSFLGKMLADPTSQQTAFSNFSYVLYGLVVGGKGWGQVLIDHPAAREGTEIYALAWQAFCSYPMGLVIGSLKMWHEYFPPHSFHAFAFVYGDLYAKSVQTACFMLGALGWTQCVRRYQQPHYFLLAATAIGHLASIPFAPSIDGGLRVYAATIPVLTILVAIAAGEVLKTVISFLDLKKLFNPMTAPDTGWSPHVLGSSASAVFGLVLVAFAIIGPLAIHMVSHTPHFAESPCPAGQETVYVRLSPGAFLRVVDDTQDVVSTRITVPEIRVKDLRKTAGTVAIKNDVDQFVAGNTMMNTYDIKSGRYVWLIAPTHLLSESLGIVRICGHDSANAQSKDYGVFYAASVHRVAWH